MDFELDSLINHGQIEIDGSLRLRRANGLLRNSDRIAVAARGRLEVADGIMGTTPAGVMSGSLVLRNATLRGFGQVGHVTSIGSTIEPGWPIGTLSAASVTLDAASELVIEIADTMPGSFDQLAVAGNVVYGGSLRLIHIAPFLEVAAADRSSPLSPTTRRATCVADSRASAGSIRHRFARGE